MRQLKVALLQITPCDTLAENLEKGIEACKKAKDMGADIALFPEMWSNGYRIYDRPAEEWKQEAISAEDDFVQAFGALAAQLGMAIGITLLERWSETIQPGQCRSKQEDMMPEQCEDEQKNIELEQYRSGQEDMMSEQCEDEQKNMQPEHNQPGPRNTLVLFDRKGQRMCTYAKVHTCDFSVERNLTPGEEFFVVDLDTAIGSVKVGAMICYDREFPECARILMLKGAEIVLVPNACPMEINRLAQLRGRAYENMMGIATCNYPETVPDCNGHSNAFDGVAYLPELPGSRDMCILEADGTEGIYLAEFDMDMIREYRSREVHGNAFRRPEKYGLLLETERKEPFVRECYRG